MGNSNTKQSENTVKNVAIAGVAVTALSLVGYLLFKNFKKSPPAAAVQEAAPSTTAPAPAKPTLVRVDSELEMSTPLASASSNPFEGVAPTTDWKTFTIKEAGFSVKYPEEFTPKKIANNLIEFGDRSSGLVAVAIERELTIEECRQLIQFSGGQQHAVKILKEKKRKVNQGRHNGYEFEYQGNNFKYYSLFVPGVYGRSFMIQYELKKNNKFEIVKHILDSLSLEEPVYQGKIFVKVAAANLEVQLPQPYYKLREVNTYEDDSLLIDAFDSRFKNVTSGFRLFKRKEKTLEALVNHRRAELEEFSAEELQINLLPDAKFYKYERSIKQDKCTEIEALFVHQDVGYIAKVYSLTDIFDKFKKDGLTCLASIKPLKAQAAKDVIVYENAKSGISMEVPPSTLIREHPLSEDIVAEMTHEQFENASENEEEFTTLIQAKKYANFTSDLKSFREMWLAENEMTSKNIRDKLGLDFLKVEKEGIVSQNGKDVFQVHLTTFHPITVEPQFAVISFWIKGTMLYQVQSTVSANSREQREPEMLAMHKTIHIK